MSPPGGGKPDAVQLLAVCKPIIENEKYHRLLEKFTGQLGSILSTYYSTNAVADDDLAALQAIFAYVALDMRNVAAAKQRTGSSVEKTTGVYANWLVAEAKRAEPDRLNRILDTFTAQMDSLGSRLLSLPLGSAWAVLIQQTGRTELADVGMDLPGADVMVTFVKKQGWASDEIRASVQRLCDAGDFSRLPSNVEMLRKRLDILRDRGRVAAIGQVLQRFVAECAAADENPNAAPHPLATPENRNMALGHFLFISRLNTLKLNAKDFAAIKEIEREAMDMVPRPMPLVIFHRLLYTTGSEDDSKLRDSTTVLPAAQKLWEIGKEDEVPLTVQSYTTYLYVLAKYRDLKGMFNLWDEILADKACKQREIERLQDKSQLEAWDVPLSKTSTDMPWPPTKFLNETLSNAFKMGGSGADMGMALYRSSIDRSSSLTPNITTVNIALRWAGHLADLQLMNEVLNDAQRLGFTPNNVTYTTMVQGLLRADRHDLARKTLDSMKTKGFNVDERLAATIISDLAREGKAADLRRAEDVIRDMRTRGVHMTVASWTALISGYFRGGWDLEGFRTVERMYQSGFKLNLTGYNIVIGHALTKTWNEGEYTDLQSVTPGLRVFRRMINENVVPTADTYSMMLGSLLRQERVEEVREVLVEMDRRGFRTHRGSLINVIRLARIATKKRAPGRFHQ